MIEEDELTIIATVLILVVYVRGHVDLGMLEWRLEVVRDAQAEARYVYSRLWEFCV